MTEEEQQQFNADIQAQLEADANATGEGITEPVVTEPVTTPSLEYQGQKFNSVEELSKFVEGNWQRHYTTQLQEVADEKRRLDQAQQLYQQNLINAQKQVDDIPQEIIDKLNETEQPETAKLILDNMRKNIALERELAKVKGFFQQQTYEAQILEGAKLIQKDLPDIPVEEITRKLKLYQPSTKEAVAEFVQDLQARQAIKKQQVSLANGTPPKTSSGSLPTGGNASQTEVEAAKKRLEGGHRYASNMERMNDLILSDPEARKIVGI